MVIHEILPGSALAAGAELAGTGAEGFTGLIGVAAVLVLGGLAVWYLARRSRRRAAEQEAEAGPETGSDSGL